MAEDSTTAADGTTLFAGKAWFDPIEAGLRERVRGFIEELFEQALETALGRSRYERDASAPKGYRNGTRERQLTGSFGPVRISVPRTRLAAEDGSTREWRSAALPRYARMRRQGEALIAGAYLAGTHTRRVKRALGPLRWLFQRLRRWNSQLRPVQGRGGQGRGQSHVAQSAHGLGGLEQARPG